MTDAENALLAKTLSGIKNDMKVKLPQQLKGLPVQLQADINRIAQKTIKGMEGIGKMSADQLNGIHAELNGLQQKLTQDYGTDGNK